MFIATDPNPLMPIISAENNIVIMKKMKEKKTQNRRFEYVLS